MLARCGISPLQPDVSIWEISLIRILGCWEFTLELLTLGHSVCVCFLAFGLFWNYWQGGRKSFSYQWKREKAAISLSTKAPLPNSDWVIVFHQGDYCLALSKHLPYSSYWRIHGLRCESWKVWKWKANLGSVGCQSSKGDGAQDLFLNMFLQLFEMNTIHSPGQYVKGGQRLILPMSINGSKY